MSKALSDEPLTANPPQWQINWRAGASIREVS